MRKQYLTPESLPDWSDYFSQITTVEAKGMKTIYISGQVGVDKQKNIVGGSLKEQTEQTFKNLQTALSSIGASITDIMKMGIYGVNYKSGDAAPIGEVIRKYFPVGRLPEMSLIGVQALANESFLIEVEAEAVAETLEQE